MKKKNLYRLGCGLGGVLVGLSCRHLSTAPGAAMFAIGAAVGVFCCYRLAKEKKDG